eukprot:gene10810-biopygen16821
MIDDSQDEKPYDLDEFKTQTIATTVSTSVGNPDSGVICAPLGLVKITVSGTATWDIEVVGVGIDSPWQTSVSSEGKPVVHAAKYLDVRMSEMHGIPIYTPLHSGSRRNVVPAGYVHGQFRDQLFQSPGNSSQVLPAGSARPGGNTPGVYVPKTGHETRNGKILGNGSCKKGYHPRWHRHKNGDFSAVCVPNSLKGKRISFE